MSRELHLTLACSDYDRTRALRDGRVRVDGLPVHFSRTDWEIRRGAPLLGADTRDVFRELLGIDGEDYQRLVAGGVV